MREAKIPPSSSSPCPSSLSPHMPPHSLLPSPRQLLTVLILKLWTKAFCWRHFDDYLCWRIYGIYPPIRQLSLYNGWLIWSDLQGLLPSFRGGCSARLTLWHGCSNRNGTNWWLRRLLDPKIALALCLSLVVQVPLPCPSRVFPLIPSSSPTFS